MQSPRPILSHHQTASAAAAATSTQTPSQSQTYRRHDRTASSSSSSYQQLPYPPLPRSSTYAPGGNITIRDRPPPPPPSKTAAAASARASQQVQYFTCTFCWTLSSSSSPSPSLSHLSSSGSSLQSTTKPRVIGRSARLACEKCYSALLGLSICWVCGGVVYRGEECVSLGWCFWHRGCYGCLFCGSKVLARGVGLGELYEDYGEGGRDGQGEERIGDGKGDKGDTKRVKNPGDVQGEKAREIEEVPVCAHCLVDLEGVDEEGMVKRAVRRVEKGGGDGGLVRARWDDLQMQKREGMQADVGWQQQQVPVQLYQHQGKGVIDGQGGSKDEGETIYVSLTDPLGEMSFRPSVMKPIPDWMRDGGSSTTRVRMPSFTNTEARKQEPSITSIAPSIYSNDVEDSRPSFELRQRMSQLSGVPSVNTQQTQQQRHRRFLNRGTSFVSAEPLTLPSSIAQRVAATPAAAEDTLSNTSVYMTPPEYPSPPGSSARHHDQSNDSSTTTAHETTYTQEQQPSRLNQQQHQTRLLTHHLSNPTVTSKDKTTVTTTNLERHSTTSLGPHGGGRTKTHVSTGGGYSANASGEYLAVPFEQRLQRRKQEKQKELLGIGSGSDTAGSKRKPSIKLRVKTFLQHLEQEQTREREREQQKREAQVAPLRLGGMLGGSTKRDINKETLREGGSRLHKDDKEKDGEKREKERGRRDSKDKEKVKEKDQETGKRRGREEE